MRKVPLMLVLLLAACNVSEPPTLESQAVPSFDSALFYSPNRDRSDAKPLAGATLKPNTTYRIFSRAQDVLYKGKKPYKCLFWDEKNAYVNREDVTPYDYGGSAGFKGSSAGDYSVKVRCYYRVLRGSKSYTSLQEIVRFKVTPSGERPSDGDEASKGWRTVFYDGFDGSRLDKRKWRTQFHWSEDPDGGRAGFQGNTQWFRAENVIVKNGRVGLVADNERVWTRYRGAFDLTGGVISSDETFNFKYGEVTFRAKLPQGNTVGMFPAAWLLPKTGRWTNEIDILELVMERPTTAEFHVHWHDRGKHKQYGANADIRGLDKGWHDYKLVWLSDRLEWYVDGKLRYRVTDKAAIPDEPMNLIFNLAVSSERSWGKPPTRVTTFPNAFEIDYVRVRQK